MRVGLLGWPVEHSLSPLMHGGAFIARGLLGWRYVLLPVRPEPERIREAVLGLRALGFAGANVTVPHKQAVIPHLDWLTPRAERLGAVNTIWIDARERLCGDNTDLPGFLQDLRDQEVKLAGRRALVLGAGGSARAVVAGLVDAGCAAVSVLNRSPARAEALLADLEDRTYGCALQAGGFPADVARHGPDADLVVNCTPLGMEPLDEELAWLPDVRFHEGQVVYDLVYAPPRTPLLRKAKKEGARAIGGLGMLVRQGALSFERWTGQRAPVEVMRHVLEDVLGC